VRAWLANARGASGGLIWSQLHHVAQSVVSRGGVETLRANNRANKGRSYVFPRDSVQTRPKGPLAALGTEPDFRRELMKPDLSGVLEKSSGKLRQRASQIEKGVRVARQVGDKALASQKQKELASVLGQVEKQKLQEVPPGGSPVSLPGFGSGTAFALNAGGFRVYVRGYKPFEGTPQEILRQVAEAAPDSLIQAQSARLPFSVGEFLIGRRIGGSVPTREGGAIPLKRASEMIRRTFGTDDPRAMAAIARKLTKEDYTTPKLDRRTQEMADAVSDDPRAMFLQIPGAALSMLPTNLREAVAQGIYGLGPGQFTEEMEGRIRSGQGTLADNVGRAGDLAYNVGRYVNPATGPLSIGADLSSLGGWAIDVGPGRAVAEAGAGFVQGMNPFEEGIDPFERAERIANALQMLHGPSAAKRRGRTGEGGPTSDGRMAGSPDRHAGFERIDSRGRTLARDHVNPDTWSANSEGARVPGAYRSDEFVPSAPGKGPILNEILLEMGRGRIQLDRTQRHQVFSFLEGLPKHLLEKLRIAFSDRVDMVGSDASRFHKEAAGDYTYMYDPGTSLARISRFAEIHAGSPRKMVDTMVHKVAHHLEWFLTPKERAQIIKLYEAERDAFYRAKYIYEGKIKAGESPKPHPVWEKFDSDYSFRDQSEWWVQRVQEWERRRYRSLLPPAGTPSLLVHAYRNTLQTAHEFAVGAYRAFERRGGIDTTGRIYDRLRTVEGSEADRAEMDQWAKVQRDARKYSNILGNGSVLPRGARKRF
jgi:hypothetical protein